MDHLRMADFKSLLILALAALELSTCSKAALNNADLMTDITVPQNKTPGGRPKQREDEFCWEKEETVAGLENFTTLPDYYFYILLTSYTNSFKSQLDSSLLLTLEILSLKCEAFTTFVQSDKKFAGILLSDIKTDIQNIAKLTTFYMNVEPTHFHVTYFCVPYKKTVKHSLVRVKYTIEKIWLLKYLRNKNIDLFKILTSDLEFNHNVASFAFGTFPTLLKQIENAAHYSFMANLPFCDDNDIQLYNEILDDFEKVLLTQNFNNDTDTVRNYNNFILKLATAEFPLISFDKVKKYFDFMITTNENVLIDFIKKVCMDKICNDTQITHLFSLLDEFPLGNVSVAAINHLYHHVKVNEYKQTANILYLFTFMEKWSADPEIKFVETTLKNEFFLFRKLIYSRSEKYSSDFAYHISKYDKGWIHYGFLMNRSNNIKVIINKTDYRVKIMEYIVKYLYDNIPNKFNNICALINSLPRGDQLVMYRKLLDILIVNDNIHNNEIFRVAYHVKSKGYKEYFKNKLPSGIRQLVWNKECQLKSVPYNFYLFPSKPYFANVKGYSNKTGAMGLFNKPLPEFKWYFDYDHLNNTFLITDKYRGSYMSVGKRFGGGEFLVHSKKIGDQNEMKWKIQLVKQGQSVTNELLVFRLSSDKAPGYLYAAGSHLDGQLFISDLKKTATDSYWNIICTDTEEEEFKNVEEDTSIPVGNERIADKRFYEEMQDVLRGTGTDALNMFSFLETVNVKRFLGTNNTLLSNLTIHQAMSRFTKNSLKFLHLQFLELMEFSSYSRNRWTGKHEKFHKDLLIRNVIGAVQSILSVYEYFLNNSSTGRTVEIIDSCEDANSFIQKYDGYLKIGHKISQIDKLSNPSLKTLIDDIFPPESYFANLVHNYLQEKNYNDCLKRQKLSSELQKHLLMKMTNDCLPHLQFHVCAHYFQLINNDSVIFEMFKKLMASYHFTNKNDYNDFLSFFRYLIAENFINLDTAADFFIYSYAQLNSTVLTETLRYIYHNLAIRLIQFASDRNVTLPSSKILKLKNVLADKNHRLMVLSELPFKEHMDSWKSTRLMRHIMIYYKEEISQLVFNMFKQTDTIKNSSFTNSNFYFFYRFPEQYIKDAFDEALKLMLSKGTVNKTEVTEFANYVYRNYRGYIPCFHNGCADDIDSILPHYTKSFLDGKVCALEDFKFANYLYVSKSYFININENKEKKTTGFTLESRPGEINRDWILEYVDANDTFRMKSSKKNYYYVSIGKRLGDSKSYTLTVAENANENRPTEWKVKLRKNQNQYSNAFMLRPVQLNKPHLYIVTDMFDGRSGSGSVLLSELKSTEYAEERIVFCHPEVWAMFCE